MLKMTTVAAIALMIAIAASPVAAQTCTIAVYGDGAGSQSLVQTQVGETFDAYVVMFVEGLANGVGYTLVATDFDDFVPLSATYGPDGAGLNIPNDNNNATFGGSNVGLGLCAVGFNGFPIEVAKYTFLALTSTRDTASLTLSGNAVSSDLDPTVPVFSDCLGVISSCEVGPELIVERPVSGENQSFGGVKNLFN